MGKFTTNTVVIGAGVVGLAIAKEISAKNKEVLVLEKEGKISIIKTDGNLSELVLTTLRDIFKRSDKIHLGGSLGLPEFNIILKKACGETMTSDFFKFNVLSKFAHNN